MQLVSSSLPENTQEIGMDMMGVLQGSALKPIMTNLFYEENMTGGGAWTCLCNPRDAMSTR